MILEVRPPRRTHSFAGATSRALHEWIKTEELVKMVLAVIIFFFVCWFQNTASAANSDVYAAYIASDGKLGNWASTNPTYIVLNSTRVGMSEELWVS